MKFALNGQSITVDADTDTPLLWVIREWPCPEKVKSTNL